MPKTMNLDLIEEMVKNYKRKQYESIVTDPINPMRFDAQSVWFSLHSLKEFIKTIETQVAAHPDYPVSNLGIRFYYSAYPNRELWDIPGYEELATLNPEYEKLHTLIAIPTTDKDGINLDFDPYDGDTYDGTKPRGVGLAIMAENHGELRPPPFGDTTGLWF